MTSRHLCSSGLLLALVAMMPACVDAPITPDQLEPNGQLRPPAFEQSAFSAQSRPEPQQAAQISAVLASEANGALQDSTRFEANVGAVHLHLRADGIQAPRPVTFRWTHNEISVLVPGTLVPSDTMALASSFPITPTDVGTWKVEILGSSTSADQNAAKVLFQREFEVF